MQSLKYLFVKLSNVFKEPQFTIFVLTGVGPEMARGVGGGTQIVLHKQAKLLLD